MKRHAPCGRPYDDPYPPVGMQRASDSAIGLPSRSTRASWMLVFLMPADVRRSFMRPPGDSLLQAWTFDALTDPFAVETRRSSQTHRLGRMQPHFAGVTAHPLVGALRVGSVFAGADATS